MIVFFKKCMKSIQDTRFILLYKLKLRFVLYFLKWIKKWMVCLELFFLIELSSILYLIFKHTSDFAYSLLILVFSITLIFSFIIYIYHNHKNEKEANYYLCFLTVNLILLGFLTTFEIFKEKEQQVEIIDLPEGTIGFRAWQCDVELSNIKIGFWIDSTCTWNELPDSIVNNKTNWGDYNSKISIIKGNDFKIYLNRKNGKDSRVIFNLKQKPIKAKYARVQCDVKFLTVVEKNSKGVKEYPNFEIGLRVPNNVTAPEIYIGFQVHYNNIEDSKAWIPGMDFQPTALNKYSSYKIKQKTEIDGKLECNRQYRFSASIFEKNAQLLYKSTTNDDASKLYQGIMSNNN